MTIIITLLILCHISVPRWQRNIAQQCISRNHTSALACASETSFLGYLGWRNPQQIGDIMPCRRRKPTKCKENEGRYHGEEDKCCEYEDAAGLALDGVAHHWARGSIMCLTLLAPKDWIYNSTYRLDITIHIYEMVIWWIMWGTTCEWGWKLWCMMLRAAQHGAHKWLQICVCTVSSQMNLRWNEFLEFICNHH